MTTEIPQRDAVRLQLAMIAGGEPDSSFIEIRPLLPSGRPDVRERAFLPIDKLHRARPVILGLAATHNVFVGCAPRIRENGTADAIKRVWCLWADCDTPNAVGRIATFQPQPNLIIRSGSGNNVHAYWQLQKPLSPAWARRANLRLALALGADRAATDAARILRPAGTLNHKHSPPRPVECTCVELDVHTFDEIVGGRADDPAYTPQPLPAPGRAANPSRTLEGLARTVHEAGVGNRNRALFWAACRSAEHGLDLTEAAEALREAGLAIGLAEFEVQRTLRSGFDAAAMTAA